MAFEEVLRRWVREHAVSWSAEPIDERRPGTDVRVGYALHLYGRPDEAGTAVTAAGRPDALESRLLALGVTLVACDRRAAEYRVAGPEGPGPPPPAEGGVELRVSGRVVFHPQDIKPISAKSEGAGGVAERLRARGAPERRPLP